VSDHRHMDERPEEKHVGNACHPTLSPAPEPRLMATGQKITRSDEGPPASVRRVDGEPSTGRIVTASPQPLDHDLCNLGA
jgi:hypothetical protein